METKFFGTFTDKSAFRHGYILIGDDVPEEDHVKHCGHVFGNSFFGSYPMDKSNKEQMEDFELVNLGLLTKTTFEPNIGNLHAVPEFFIDKDGDPTTFMDFIGLFPIGTPLRNYYVVLRVTKDAGQKNQIKRIEEMANLHFGGCEFFLCDLTPADRMVKKNLLCTLVDNGFTRYHLG